MILTREENSDKVEFYKRIVEKQDKLFLQKSENENGAKYIRKHEKPYKKAEQKDTGSTCTKCRVRPYPSQCQH
jgi:hypothetical protein